MTVGKNLRHQGKVVVERLKMNCRTCGTDPHQDGCPVEGMAKYVEELLRWSCPTCRAAGYTVEADQDDFLTCRKCRSRFNGMVGGEGETLILLPSDDSFDNVCHVTRFAKKAPRRGFHFKSDIICNNFKASAKLWRRERAAKRKAGRR